MGAGSMKTPQLLMSRMTPPLRRMSWPAVRTILGGGEVSALSASRVVGGVFEREGEVRGKGGDLLLDLGEVAGAGLVGEGVSCCLEGEGTKGGDETNNADNLVQHLGGQAVAGVLCVNRRRGLS